MRQRCLNPRAQYFYCYGGRGIKICDRWNSFPNFLKDMGNRPSGKWLERINNDGDYEPENCRWATMQEQMMNKRNTWRFKGKTQREWCDLLGIEQSTLSKRFKLYGDVYIPSYAIRALRRSTGYQRTGR